MSPYEAADWREPRSMARDLLPRHRDLSTVQAMVRNHFGRSLPIAELARLRDTAPKRAFIAAKGFELGSTAEHEDAMRVGSRKLLSAIWQRHQRAMLVGKALGRNVVIPEAR